MKNYGDRGRSYPSRPQAEADNTLRDLHNSSYDSIIVLLFIKNNSQFKNKAKACLPPWMLTGQCPDYAHAQASSVFSSKDNRTVILTRQDFLPDHTANGNLSFIFSSNILDFRRSHLSYIKNWLAVRDFFSRFYRQLGRLATRKSRSARFKNILSNLKLVSEVSCSKSSNICLICSRSSLKMQSQRYESSQRLVKNYIMISWHQFF